MCCYFDTTLNVFVHCFNHLQQPLYCQLMQSSLDIFSHSVKNFASTKAKYLFLLRCLSCIYLKINIAPLVVCSHKKTNFISSILILIEKVPLGLGLRSQCSIYFDAIRKLISLLQRKTYIKAIFFPTSRVPLYEELVFSYIKNDLLSHFAFMEKQINLSILI